MISPCLNFFSSGLFLFSFGMTLFGLLLEVKLIDMDRRFPDMTKQINSYKVFLDKKTDNR